MLDLQYVNTYLDKEKTYIGYQIGQGAIARAIQIKSKMLVDCEIDTQKVASHAFALIFQNGDWHIYESHLKSHGVHEELFSDWIEEEKPENNFVFEYPLNIKTLELYAKFKYPYSLGAIGKIATSIHGQNYDKGKDDPTGLICSEYIALAMDNHKPCFKFNIPPYRTIPLHIQLLDNQN